MLTFHFFCNFVDRITLQNFRKCDFLLFQHLQLFRATNLLRNLLVVTILNSTSYFYYTNKASFFRLSYRYMDKIKVINLGNTKNMSSNNYWKINEIRFYLICSKESFACITLKSKNGSIH